MLRGGGGQLAQFERQGMQVQDLEFLRGGGDVEREPFFLERGGGGPGFALRVDDVGHSVRDFLKLLRVGEIVDHGGEQDLIADEKVEGFYFFLEEYFVDDLFQFLEVVGEHGTFIENVLGFVINGLNYLFNFS